MGQDSSTSVNSQPSQHSVTQHKKKENWVAAEVYYSEYDNAMWADDEEINERNDKYSRQLKTAQTKYGKKNIGHFTLRFKWCYFLSNMEKLRDLLEFTAIKYFVEKQKLSKEFSRSNRSILNWVADNITYNIKHSGNALNAAQAFYLRQGVCLEFSNIALSLLLNYGKNVDTAYVCVGYKYDKIKQKWLGHAFIEVDGQKIEPQRGKYVESLETWTLRYKYSRWVFKTNENANNKNGIQAIQHMIQHGY
eukprot:247350_1